VIQLVPVSLVSLTRPRHSQVVHQGTRCEGKNLFKFSIKQPYREQLEQTSNLIINLDHDEWILEDDTLTLVEREFGQ